MHGTAFQRLLYIKLDFTKSLLHVDSTGYKAFLLASALRCTEKNAKRKRQNTFPYERRVPLFSLSTCFTIDVSLYHKPDIVLKPSLISTHEKAC